MSSKPQQRHALVIVDLQRVTLNALAEPDRAKLLNLIRIVRHTVEHSPVYCNDDGPKVLHCGLSFSPDYREIPSGHRLFGAFKRLYDKTKQAPWLVQGQEMTNICLDNSANESDTTWRSTHLPNVSDLAKNLEGVTHVTVVGIKTGYAIQAHVQALCDMGLQVSVIRECVGDDDQERHEAVLEHLLPVYADVTSMAEFVDRTIGYNRFQDLLSRDNSTGISLDPKVRYLADCGRGGHAFLYTSHLLKHHGWSRFPQQGWYQDDISGKSYQCPLGKATLNFCDEPQFSQISMYIKGREWLDEKEKIWELAKDVMPTTYRVERQRWVAGAAPDSDQLSGTNDLLYFIKECNKNGGRAVEVSPNISDVLVKCADDASYVVQAHVPNPLLTRDSKKCHIKSYFLLTHKESQWELRMYQDSFLCVASKPWSESDLSPESQITVKRSLRVVQNQDCDQWKGWPLAYDACQDVVSKVVQRAIAQGRLQPRPGLTTQDPQPQFEVFSADVMIDTNHKPWLIEFNFGCVLFDPSMDQPLTTAGLMEYQRLYDQHGKTVEINDHEMIADTIAHMFQQTSRQHTKWNLVALPETIL